MEPAGTEEKPVSILDLQKRELDLRERDVAAREREVTAREGEMGIHKREVEAREKEVATSKWSNPLVIGLFAATAGLIGNIIVTIVNNNNSLAVQRLQSQSNLVLEVIKTGSSEAACKNLIFFIGLGMLDDASQAIRRVCATAPTGAPSLPASTSTPTDILGVLLGTVQDAESGTPIAFAAITVTSSSSGSTVTDAGGIFNFPIRGTNAEIVVEKSGYEPLKTRMSVSENGKILLMHKKRP